MMYQQANFIRILTQSLALGGLVVESAAIPGRAADTGKDRHTVLNETELPEEVLERIYDEPRGGK